MEKPKNVLTSANLIKQSRSLIVVLLEVSMILTTKFHNLVVGAVGHLSQVAAQNGNSLLVACLEQKEDGITVGLGTGADLLRVSIETLGVLEDIGARFIVFWLAADVQEGVHD